MATRWRSWRFSRARRTIENQALTLRILQLAPPTDAKLVSPAWCKTPWATHADSVGSLKSRCLYLQMPPRLDEDLRRARKAHLLGPANNLLAGLRRARCVATDAAAAILSVANAFVPIRIVGHRADDGIDISIVIDDH